MKNKLKFCAVIVLAVALRPEAKALSTTTISGFVDVCSFGGPGAFSGPVGSPVQDSQGNLYVACGTGDEAVSPYLGFGGIVKFSGFGPGGPGYWEGDGNLTSSTGYIFGSAPGDGWYPSTSPVIGDVNGDGNPNMIVGTGSGGANGVGTMQIFSITPTGIITPQITITLTTPGGTYPSGKPVVGPDGSIIFSCESGGTGSGTVPIFRHEGYDELTGDILLQCNGANGQTPVNSLTVFITPDVIIPGIAQKTRAKGNGPKANANSSTNYTLFGVTFFGGTNGAGPGTGGYGTVYKVNSDSSGFQTLHVFSTQRATNGYGPAGGMALSGNTLYGTTSGGGKNGTGTLFKIDTSGSNFMVLKSFSAYGSDSSFNYTNSDGMGPEGDLIISGDTLYGTTFEGGTNGGGGVVYSVNTNGDNFAVLHSFSNPVNNGSGVYTNSEGGGTRAGLLLTGHVLFGTTPYGGIYGGGTLFAIILPGPPSLNIAPSGGGLTVSWPSSATNFMLQKNSDLTTTNWSGFGGAPNNDGTNKSVNFMPAASAAYFRLLNTNGP